MENRDHPLLPGDPPLLSDHPLLLIDDDRELTELLQEYLRREGLQVEIAHDGNSGLEQAISGKHALVILDIMLPGRDGFEVITELRKQSPVPVIMLTAKGEEIDRIVGLELGADDYLPKPFNPRELLARIKAVLRRSGQAPAQVGVTPSQTLQSGQLLLDLDAYVAQLGSTDLELTAIEFSLLRELMQSAGRALSRDDLLDRVRGRDYDLFDRSIDVHISHLRQKLGDDPRRPRFIKTVRSVGYIFAAEVQS